MTTTPTNLAHRDIYPDAVAVGEMFVDHTYQRDADMARVRRMAQQWDRRLAGMLEVSDRGPHAVPRYAVIDGQHRYEAAKLHDRAAVVVAQVHTGLTVADEAILFDKLNRQRKQPNRWDSWRARRAAGDSIVTTIETIARHHGLTVDMSPTDGCVACTAALEKITRLGGTALLDSTLRLIAAVWSGQRDSLDAPIVGGLALILHHLASDIDHERLTAALLDVQPHQIKSKVNNIAELTHGTKPTLTALAIIAFYNKRGGRRIEVTTRSFGGGSVNARSTRHSAAQPQSDALRAQSRSYEGAPQFLPPQALPPVPTYTDAQAEAVDAMGDQPEADVAAALGLSARTVRRIRADLGLGVSA
ncbi:DUF6551 family protein [Mycobacterium dioxanotrophicus]|jgi:hypothetical protein|uniref:DUF6551 family protein n=1 Tax=Mycobacterium dioxanotrophicus TaxID=482462 RepID=UPI0018DFF177|nr:DUF6551 family protein [Mycobacterium dioxanotrophicus]